MRLTYQERMRIKAEKEAEKKRIREEKKKEKERLKKIERHKKSRQKSNKKYYAKIRAKQLAERKKEGDEKGSYLILLVKDKKRYDKLGEYRWKNAAFKAYNEAIEENSKISFPVQTLVSEVGNATKKVEYEIIIASLLKKDEENNVTQFRNKEGKYVDTVVIDRTRHCIIAKHDWFIEETFYVYGYHPLRDRKTYPFILNNIVLNNINSKDDIRSITTHKNRLFINYINDFDFVVCKNCSETKRLYLTLQKDIPKQYKDYVLFLGEIVQKNSVSKLLDRIAEKTGWERKLLNKYKM